MNVSTYGFRVKAVQFRSNATEKDKENILKWINGNSFNKRTVAAIDNGILVYTLDERGYIVSYIRVSHGEWLVKLASDAFRVYSAEEFERLTTAIPSSYTYVNVVYGQKQS